MAPGWLPAIVDVRNLPAAELFKVLSEDHGPDEAMRTIQLDEIGRHVPTVTAWLHTYIDNLTGLQPLLRRVTRRSIFPVHGATT